MTRNAFIFLPYLFLSVGAWAGLPVLPVLPDPASAKHAPANSNGQATVELVVGEAIVRDKDGNTWRASSGANLSAGDLIRVLGDGRVRIKVADGDVLHLGSEALLGLDGNAHFNLWTGKLTLYLKSLEAGAARPYVAVQAPGGTLEAGAGKFGLDAGAGQTMVYAFNNWSAWRDEERFELGAAGRDWRLEARWTDLRGRTTALPSGYRLLAGSDRPQALTGRVETDFTFATTPESLALKAALEAVRSGKDDLAKPRFMELQKAFPSNAQAAYQLGRIALSNGDNPEALKQWQMYARLDPSGAEKIHLGPRLTLLIQQTLKDEIQRALAAEASISNSPPEAGSVAVLPFMNRGDPAQATLSKGLTAMVISDLSKIPDLKVLERAKLQKLLDEMKLSDSGLVEQKSAIRAGRLMKAEKIMLGDYQLQTDKK